LTVSLFTSPRHATSQIPAPSTIYPLSLHDALPIFHPCNSIINRPLYVIEEGGGIRIIIQICTIFPDFRGDVIHIDRASYFIRGTDRKSTRLNSSHVSISYAVFCLKKKKTHDTSIAN